MASSTSANSDARRKKVLEVLNKARSMELYAIMQYMYQHYTLSDEDYGELATKIKRIAIDEMRHAEMFAERIKDINGETTTELLGTMKKKQSVREIYPFNSAIELDTIEVYNEFHKTCMENGDVVSMKLFETIIGEEQVHQTYFDNEATHIKILGDTYLSKMAGTSSSAGASTEG